MPRKDREEEKNRKATAGTCRELLRREVSLFPFAFVSDVEPTNNAAERALRHGVLWRKMSYDPKSVEGLEYLACIWSVVETCRQHGRGVWDFLTACMAAAADGSIIPSLLTLPKKRPCRLAFKWAVSNYPSGRHASQPGWLSSRQPPRASRVALWPSAAARDGPAARARPIEWMHPLWAGLWWRH
jgi:hypothetical protein